MSDSITEGWLPDDGSAPEVPGFDLIRVIGEGGFGKVWMATNRTIGGLLAVKVIPLASGSSRDAAGREIKSLTYLREVSRIHHPNLLDVKHIDTSPASGLLFYTMDLADDVSGDPPSSDTEYQPATLRKRLESGPFGKDECLRCTRQLLEGLAFLHERGMVHRDVKPANCIFVEGDLKLADFGLLTKADRNVSRVGTLRYMPPNGEMDARADVYAAGLMIYEMITGLTADSFPHLGERANAVADDPTLCALNRLALKACRENPKQRFQDAQEMLSALEAMAQPPRARRQNGVLIGGALLVIVFSAAGYWASRPDRVHVNFISEPFDAAIYLDGTPLLTPDGTAYTTPCTVPYITAEVHGVVLKHSGSADFDAGQIDFSTTREIIARLDPQE